MKSEVRSQKPATQNSTLAAEIGINVPRETWTYADDMDAQEAPDSSSAKPLPAPAPKASAAIPLSYIREPLQRIEIYRKLAQITDKADLNALQAELRDRFGPVPSAVELLLQVTELKLLAAARNVTAIETKEEKIMLTRNNDYLMVGGKFPRLTKTQPAARLREIRRLLMAL